MPKYIVLKPIGVDGVSYMPGTADKPTLVSIDPRTYGDTLDGHVKEGYLKPLKEDVPKEDKPKDKPPTVSATTKFEDTPISVVVETPVSEAPAETPVV